MDMYTRVIRPRAFRNRYGSARHSGPPTQNYVLKRKIGYGMGGCGCLQRIECDIDDKLDVLSGRAVKTECFCGVLALIFVLYICCRHYFSISYIYYITRACH